MGEALKSKTHVPPTLDRAARITIWRFSFKTEVACRFTMVSVVIVMSDGD